MAKDKRKKIDVFKLKKKAKPIIQKLKYKMFQFKRKP